MRKLLLLPFLFPVVAYSAAMPQKSIKGADWLVDYNTAQATPAKVGALAYLAGFRDAFSIIQSVSKLPLAEMNCSFEANVSNQDVADVYKAYLITHPELRDAPVFITLRHVMIDTWPCAKQVIPLNNEGALR